MLEIGKKIIHLSTVDSTNNYAANLLSEGKTEHGTVILADEQTHGRGQRMTQWQSEAGMNLTASLILINPGVKLDQQFRITMFISLVLKNFLEKYGLKASVKWPNDIYIWDKKICGVLIENSVRGGVIGNAVIGIGLNVNQIVFEGLNATSIKTELKQHFVINEIVLALITAFNQNLPLLDDQEKLKSLYQDALYLRNVTHIFYDQNDLPFKGKIVGVNESGRLQIDCGDLYRSFDLKEVRFKQNAS